MFCEAERLDWRVLVEHVWSKINLEATCIHGEIPGLGVLKHKQWLRCQASLKNQNYISGSTLQAWSFFQQSCPERQINGMCFKDVLRTFKPALFGTFSLTLRRLWCPLQDLFTVSAV